MFTGELRPYQLEASRKMIRQGKILVAMVMGAGKTPTTLAATEDLLECRDVKQGLVVALAGLKYQWQAEIRKFTTHDALVIDGDLATRKKQYEEARTGKYPYVILNYEQVRDDWKIVRDLPRDFVIADEVTAIKGFTAKRSKAMKRLQAPFTFGLTGQPIENRLEELYSIMQWVDPEVLGRYDLFDNTFIKRNHWGKVVRYNHVEFLREIMEEHWVLVHRDDIADQLPDRIETDLFAHMDSAGADLYEQIISDLLKEMSAAEQMMGKGFDLFSHYNGGGKESAAALAIRGRVMSRMTCARLLCGHPELLRISAKKYNARGANDKSSGSIYAAALAKKGLLDRKMGNPKLDLLLYQVESGLAAGHKIVVFTGFTEALNIIQNATSKMAKGVSYHGGMNAKAKEAARSQFREDSGTRLFVSSDAGGYGVDLPQAALLINYDKPWSAGLAGQRNSRIDRVSSEHGRIDIDSLYVIGSVEEWIGGKVVNKSGLGSAVLKGTGIDREGHVRADSQALKAFLEEASVR